MPLLYFRLRPLARGLWPSAKDPGDPDTGLVEDHEGGGHHKLGDDVGRGQDGCHDKDADDHISSVASEHPSVDHPELGEEEEKQGEFKGKAEGEEQHAGKRERFLEFRRRLIKSVAKPMKNLKIYGTVIK